MAFLHSRLVGANATPHSLTHVSRITICLHQRCRRLSHQLRATGATPSNTGIPAYTAAAFKTLSAVSACLAAPAILEPQVLLEAAGAAAGAGSLDALFLQIAGCTLAISAAVEYCLTDAAANGRLGSATYQRLLLGVVVKSAGYLAVFGLASKAWTPLVCALYPTAALLSIGLAATTLVKATARSNGVAAALPGLLQTSMPQTTAGWVYSVFTLLYVATAAACFAPEVLFIGTASPLGSLLKGTWAPGFVLAAVACLVLKDAADRGRLGASTFKRLNLGLGVLETGYSFLLGSSILGGVAVADASGWSNLGGSVVIAGFCLFQYLTAKK